jgi:hypothetical protein
MCLTLMLPPRCAKSSIEYQFNFKACADCLAANTVRTATQRMQHVPVVYTGEVAAEPGLDYRAMDIEGFDGPTEVTVIDYSAYQFSTSERMTKMVDLQEFFDVDRPQWSKVRWINVDGLNWQCIKLLALKYNIHRLAIEDLLSVQRTKVDLYQDRNYPRGRDLTPRYLRVPAVTRFDWR